MKNHCLQEFLKVEEEAQLLHNAGNVVDENLLKSISNARMALNRFVSIYESLKSELEELKVSYRVLIRENNIMLSGFKNMLDEMER